MRPTPARIPNATNKPYVWIVTDPMEKSSGSTGISVLKGFICSASQVQVRQEQGTHGNGGVGHIEGGIVVRSDIEVQKVNH
jgi:hypothetical protein